MTNGTENQNERPPLLRAGLLQTGKRCLLSFPLDAYAPRSSGRRSVAGAGVEAAFGGAGAGGDAGALAAEPLVGLVRGFGVEVIGLPHFDCRWTCLRYCSKPAIRMSITLASSERAL